MTHRPARIYSVKEIYYTLQGEGIQAGRPAVFCRFAGCNLWSGREQDRAKATCRFCDTDFRGISGPGGGRFIGPTALAEQVRSAWPGNAARPFVVCTGGEPLLQFDAQLIAALHAQGFEIAVETNGTRPAPQGIDWLCVSPKAGAPLVQTSGDELKLVFPQVGVLPEDFVSLAFGYYLLQPMGGARLAANTEAAIAYCKAHPQWRLSVQTHKVLGIA